jgi:hypothetical protein
MWCTRLAVERRGLGVRPWRRVLYWRCVRVKENIRLVGGGSPVGFDRALFADLVAPAVMKAAQCSRARDNVRLVSRTR